MARLSVNVNKIATLRNTRPLDVPSLVKLSKIALDAGAAGITIHPRPDERHIRAKDVDDIADVVAKYPAAELNIEGNPFHNLIEHCRRVRPAQATLVPDSPEAKTSNSGWNLWEMSKPELAALRSAVTQLRSLGCRVSLFVEPRPDLMSTVKDLTADRIELYTEPYATAFARNYAARTVADYASAAKEAARISLGVNAGHDLSLENLSYFLRNVRPIDEVSIGHALIADALEFGLAETVKKYKKLADEW